MSEQIHTTRAGTVLIVDDVAANLQLLNQILSEAGYDVRAASSGIAAMRSIDSSLPDLVLLDVRMPELDGLEVCRRIGMAVETSDLPVILISAADETTDIVRGLEAGAVDYITKPFEAQEVLARVRTHLALHHLQRELARANQELARANESLESRVRERTIELEKANADLRAEILRRQRVEAALRESESRLHRAQAVANIGSWHLDFSDNALSWTDEIYRIFDLKVGSPVSYESFLSCIHPDDRDRVDTAWQAALDGKPYDIEHRICTTGTVKWVRERAGFEYDDSGHRVRAIGTVQDITQRKEYENQQRLMMDELDHRVKNNLAAVVALAQRTAAVSDSLTEFSDRFLPRVMSMSRAHEALAATKWSGIRLDQAIQLLVVPQTDLQPGRITSIDGPDVLLPATTAMPLCLTLHELAANARKHGALGVHDGRLEIRWRVDEQLNVRLSWDEYTNGNKVDEILTQESRESGMGFTLIRGLIEHEAGGRVELDLTPDGLRCRLTVPMSRQ